ncbi:MAG TPA: HWE histidine kinase domain-containing protein [Roseiarcus sp.]|jgi:PAS domain S-box-containing protein
MTRLPASNEGPQSYKELLQSHKELLWRLEEAEETIRAIRQGEIDALVMRPVQHEQVFTLGGDNDSYRAFMETMGHGAAALGANGEILYANSILTALIGKPLAQLQGLPFANQFDETTGAQIKSLLAAAEASNDAASSCEISLTNGDEDRYYLASAEPLQTGVVNGWAITLTDLTDRVRAEKSVAAERTARAIIASANEAVVVCDIEGAITHANAAVQAIAEGDVLGRPFHEAIQLAFNDATGLVQTADLVRMAISGAAVQGLEAYAAKAPRTKDLLVSAAPLSPEGAISGCVITMVDLSQRKAAEKQQNLLMAELDHRVKNTLTLVLSILERTREESIDEFKKSFSARIHALAATHNLLSKSSWSGLSIGEVVTTELAPYLQDPHDRVKLKGATITLKPRAAIALGLIVHELASNAVKYGALSCEGGAVSLFSTLGAPGEPATVEWREFGGPPVTKPRSSGFGHVVITRSLGYSPQGGAEVRFEPDGLRCLIRIPPEDID